MSTAETSEPTVRREIRNSRYFHLAVAALTVGALVGAWRATGFLQNMALLVAGLSIPYLLELFIRLPPEFVARYTKLVIPVGVSLIVGYYVGSRFQSMSPSSFPRQDGLVADFASGPGGPARTALGTQFSLFSDSVWNARSKIWYERLDEPGTDGNGFLRVYYQLEPSSAIGPYVGLYTDFTLPPPHSYDLSRFRRVGMRIRSAPSRNDFPIDVGIVLYSDNVVNPDYAFPRWQVPRQNLRADWTTVKAEFIDFVRPPFVNFAVAFDPTRTYRVGLIISIDRSDEVHGYVDVDDLHFE